MNKALLTDLLACLLLVLLYAPCEAIYLTLTSPQYTNMFKRLQGLGTGMPFRYAALPFGPIAYLCYVPAWYLLCLRDSVLGMASPITGVWKSFVFAVAVYGTYNFTNKVTFPSWPVRMLLQDFAWGVSCLTVVGAAVVYLMTQMRNGH